MNEEFILKLTNQQRTSAKLNPLRENKLLQIAADKKTKEMVTDNYFDHYSPQNKTIADLTPKTYKYFALGENLAFGYNTEEELVNAWMKSPTHKENILYKKYKDNAMSIAPIGDSYLIAHVFGTRQQDYIAEVKGIREITTAKINTNLAGLFYISATLFLVVAILLILQHQKQKT